MNKNSIKLNHALPVLMSFFVMSFVDLVGIGVDRVSKDMNLSATLAQLIPSAAFLWFLLLSVPVGVMQSRLGKRFMLNFGMGVTALGLLVPFFFYSFIMVLTGFALLGIGNTIVQVSANPLLVDVVEAERHGGKGAGVREGLEGSSLEESGSGGGRIVGIVGFGAAKDTRCQDAGFIEAEQRQGEQDGGSQFAGGQKKREDHNSDVKIQSFAPEMIVGQQADTNCHHHEEGNLESDAKRQDHASGKGQIQAQVEHGLQGG